MSQSAPVLDFSKLVVPKPTFVLYNGGLDTVVGKFDSTPFVIQPDSTLLVQDRAAIIHLLGEDGRSGQIGVLGVRLLFGDERDDLSKAEARQVAREADYKHCLQLKRAHEAAVAAAIEYKVEPPAPSPAVRAAMRRIVDYESEGSLSAPTHPCPVCWEPLFSAEEQSAHLATFHRDRAQSPAPVPVPAQAEPRELEAVERRADRRRDQERGQGIRKSR